jgi:hypothetical protein
MDSNTFALALIAVGAIVFCVAFSQIFATVRARIRRVDPAQLEEFAGRAASLDARLGALVHDVTALEARLASLEGRD